MTRRGVAIVIERPLFRRHPFSGRRELNTRAARERDAWIETAQRYCRNEAFWRDRTKARCAASGHTFVRRGDDSGDSCTCCGEVVAD